MSEEKFEASARRFTRITRHGLVEENAVTGETRRISQQPEDTRLGKHGKRRLRLKKPGTAGKNAPGGALKSDRTRLQYRLAHVGRATGRTAGSNVKQESRLKPDDARRRLRLEEPGANAAKPQIAVSSRKAYQQKYRRLRLNQDSRLRSRLRFEYSAERTGLIIPEESGLAQSSRLKFEQSSSPKLKFNKRFPGAAAGSGGPPNGPEDSGSGIQNAHAKGKFRKGFFGGRSALSKEVDEQLDKLSKNSDNEGVQAANQHRKWMSTGMREGGRAGKQWRQGEDKRVAARAKKRQVRANREKIYQQKHGKPSLSARGRNWFTQRKFQIKRFAEKRLGVKNAQRAEKLLAFAARKVMQVIRLVLTAIGGPVLGVVAVYIGMASILLMMFGAFVNNAVVVMSSYSADNVAVEATSAYYSKLEAELEKKIIDVPTDWRWLHIDEFRYDLDPIEHDPYQLMAYLSVKYPGFVFNDVKTELDYLYSKRYELILDEEVEVRYRDVDNGDGTYSQESYNYYILNVILDSRPQEPLLLNELRADPQPELEQWYNVLMETRGARQAYANPFDIDWTDYVSSLYGYRVDPIAGRELQRHRGLDIALPRGTPIKAGVTGTVRHVGYDAIMGNYIIVDADGADSTMKYGHCDSVRVSAGDKVIAGETVIGTVGNSGQSTGVHLHVEILENGEYINPIYSLEFRVKTEGA